jgi:alpha-D-ribose 1-methylphosphonate 5-triphosphate synthase subunit PhnL
MTIPQLQIVGVAKSFELHNQSGIKLPVLSEVNLSVSAGECVVLDGPSGMGKSTLLKMIYANYRTTAGCITVRTPEGLTIDVTKATPRELLTLRRDTIGYVSQFLRVIPRVPSIAIVAEHLVDDIDDGIDDLLAREATRLQAIHWLKRLRIPDRLWHLPPATFSGGEQQRINIARNMIKRRPLLLLDEPTASLDGANTKTMIDIIREVTASGVAVLGIFHDNKVGDAVATRRVAITSFKANL